MGAKVEGAGTSEIRIQGVTSLHGAKHAVVADRIEAGTFALATAAAGGNVLLSGARFDHLGALIKLLRQADVSVEVEGRGLRVVRKRSGRMKGVDIETAPYPDFPTDLQAQAMALLCLADGQSRIRETIFENRFMHAPELTRLGAQISVHGNEAIVTGVERLVGAPVMATDLRASVSLVVAGLAAEGETTVNRVYHLDRGFEGLEAKLAGCGAEIRRVREEQAA
jgi:UDP-N-acetylglucosamine 1-carboxyvinyltransferase